MKYLEDNIGAASVKLEEKELKELNEYVENFTPKGARYDFSMGEAF